MKKVLSLLMVAGLLLVSGCEKVSDLLVPEETGEETMVTQTMEPTNTPTPEEELQTKIPLSQMIQMTNDWELLGDYSYEITQKGKKDRIVLGTSAQAKNGEFMWDDSQYWTVAVISEDGAYNLFSERMQGRVYMEVNEGFIKGIVTPVITVYIFSGNDREIRNYTFDGECFVESQEYTTKNFSTGGINNRYTSIQEYKPM
ncbi:MAG: hypothetical protein IJ304_03590 [Clostridia bacterium]|nr:hypothetical protein [Clostridia bacterium]